MSYHPDEFIGQDLTVTKAKNKNLEGLTGRVVDETKKTFTITTSKGTKQILKNGCTFKIGNQTVEGGQAALRPEERIKRKR